MLRAFRANSSTASRISKSAPVRQVNYSHSESGIFIPIMAVMLTSMMAAIFLYGLNNIITKRATYIFRNQARAVCRNVVENDLYNLPPEAANSFSKFVNSTYNRDAYDFQNSSSFIKQMGEDNFELLKADLIMPLMPADRDFVTAAAPHFTDSRTFTELGVPDCQGVIKGAEWDCHLRPSVEGAMAVPELPSNVMRNKDSAQNTIACDFRARIKNFTAFGALSEWTEISAVYSYWRPPRGFFPEYVTGGDRLKAPGLVLAIAPHMTTFLPTSGINQFSRPAVPDAEFPGLAAAAFGRPATHSSPALASSGPGSQSRWINTDILADRNELFASCVNPLTIVRNRFLSTFLQYATRHGLLRAGTEILLAGTQSRKFVADGPNQAYLNAGIDGAIATGDDGDFDPYIQVGTTEHIPQQVVNPPVVLVPYTQDLLNLSYQLPYVNYDSGGLSFDDEIVDASDRDDVLWQTQFDTRYAPAAGLINPWNADTTITDTSHPNYSPLGVYHNLISRQLRMCAHLYANSTTLRFPHNESIYNAAFEPSIYAPSDFHHIGSLTGGGGGISYEQEGGVNAIELVSMLGSIQSCPYPVQVTARAGATTNLTSSCVKPSYEDLRPDLLGLLYYLTENDMSNQIKAYENLQRLTPPSPTVPVNFSFSPPVRLEPFVFAERVANPVPLDTRPLIYVTHTAPGAAEAAQIRDFIDNHTSVWNHRPITIIFIPQNEIERNRSVNFRTALNIPVTTSFVIDPTQPSHRLVVLSPDEIGNDDVNYCGGGACDEFAYREYWIDLWQIGHPGYAPSVGSPIGATEGIDARAQSIFTSLTTLNQRKF